MKEKKSPQRMCIACKEMANKTDLIRIVKTPEGDITLDFTGKKNGRGAYVHKDRECLMKIKKGRLLSKAFKQNVSDEIYDKLIEEFESADD